MVGGGEGAIGAEALVTGGVGDDEAVVVKGGGGEACEVGVDGGGDGEGAALAAFDGAAGGEVGVGALVFGLGRFWKAVWVTYWKVQEVTSVPPAGSRWPWRTTLWGRASVAPSVMRSGTTVGPVKTAMREEADSAA